MRRFIERLKLLVNNFYRRDNTSPVSLSAALRSELESIVGFYTPGRNPVVFSPWAVDNLWPNVTEADASTFD